MKKFKLAALVTLLCFVFTIPAFAAVDWDKEPKNYDVKVYINSKNHEVLFPAGMGVPFIAKGRTFVPYRILSESLGAKVDWDGGARKVTASGNNRTVELFIGNSNYKVNGKNRVMDVEPFILKAEGRTYIPARYLVEGLNYTIDFAQDGKVMYICSFTKGQSEAERKTALEEIVKAGQGNPVVEEVKTVDLGMSNDPAKEDFIQVGNYNIRVSNNGVNDPGIWFGMSDAGENKDIKVVCTSHPEWNNNNRKMWDGTRMMQPQDVWKRSFKFFKDGYSPVEPKSGDKVTFDVYGKVNDQETKLGIITKTLP